MQVVVLVLAILVLAVIALFWSQLSKPGVSKDSEWLKSPRDDAEKSPTDRASKSYRR
jgi:hypothetical protein